MVGLFLFIVTMKLGMKGDIKNSILWVHESGKLNYVGGFINRRMGQ